MSKVGILLFTILLVNPFGSKISALNSNPPSGLSQDVPLNISIKLWGFDSNYQYIRSNLLNLLPSSGLYESINPSNSLTTPYSILTANNWWDLYSNLKFDIPSTGSDISIFSTNNNISQFTQDGTLNPKSRFYHNENNTNNIAQGVEFDLIGFSKALELYNEKTGYTIHIMNLEFVDNHPDNTGKLHWFRIGELYSSDSYDDMRNLGIVGDSGLFYDPTGFAPTYENESFSDVINDNPSLVSYLEKRINHFVERIIIGSPLSINYYAYPDRVQISNIVFHDGSPTNIDETESKLSDSRSLINNSVLQLFDMHKVNYYQNSINLKSSDIRYIGLRAFWDQLKTHGDKVIITNQDAENLKNLIRDNKFLYRDYPYGYFLAVITYLDADGREFIMINDDGIEINYTHQYLGFGLINYYNWTQHTLQYVQGSDPVKSMLNMLGRMVGNPELDWLSAQIESPMSIGPNSQGWGHEYAFFERDSFAKRIGMYYKIGAYYKIHSFRDQILTSKWRWIDDSALDKAELTILEGDVEFGKANYSGGAELYIKGYQLWEKARDDINLKIIMIINGSYFILFIVSAYMLLDIMYSYIISKKQFEEIYSFPLK